MAVTWIETDTNANTNISSATAVGVYTATGDKFVMPQLLADAVAGSGDYVYYLTLQVNGAGSSYVIGPKTTHTAAAGETAVGAQGGLIFVRSGDVLTVYIDGLAGDTTTPDVTVRWAELDSAANVTTWKGDVPGDLDASGNVLAKLANTVTHGGDAAQLLLKQADIVNPDMYGIALRLNAVSLGGKGLSVQSDDAQNTGLYARWPLAQMQDVADSMALAPTPGTPADGSVYDLLADVGSSGLTAQETADAVLDEVVEGTHTMRELLRLFASMLVAKASGGGTDTLVFRDIDNTMNRVTITIDAHGNRSAVVLDES